MVENEYKSMNELIDDNKYLKERCHKYKLNEYDLIKENKQLKEQIKDLVEALKESK